MKQPRIERECAGWLKRTNRAVGCDLKATYSKDTVKNLSPIADSCHQLSIWSAFHGMSSDSALPFTLSQKLAQTYHAKEVNLDGSTCLWFDNLFEVDVAASQLGRDDKITRYRITGNQNIGVTLELPLITTPWERENLASKVTVQIVNGLASFEFAECSTAGDSCRFTTKNHGSNGNPNSKTCMHQQAKVEQFCCPKKEKSEAIVRGKWGAPSVACDSSH